MSKTRKTILASAWDLFLLRMPELIISNEGNDYTSVYYVCTAEKVLRKLGEMFVIRRVSSLLEGPGSLPPSVGFCTDLLSEEVGEEITLEFGSMCNEMLKNSDSRRAVNLDQILTISSNLEQQAAGMKSLGGRNRPG